MSTASPPQPKQPDGNGVWLQNATLDQALTFFQAREVAGFVELALHMGGVACGLKSDWVAQHAPAFNTLGLADMLVKHMPDASSAQPSTAAMLAARSGKAKGMPLQPEAAKPMGLEVAATVLAPLPKVGGPIPLGSRFAPLREGSKQ